jgi:hypothetical protein
MTDLLVSVLDKERRTLLGLPIHPDTDEEETASEETEEQ